MRSVVPGSVLCYNFDPMVETFLVPPKTVVTSKGDGAGVDVSPASNRVFLLTLEITDIVEQESLDVTVYGSADGANWSAKPLVSFPQKFYRGPHPCCWISAATAADFSVLTGR